MICRSKTRCLLLLYFLFLVTQTQMDSNTPTAQEVDETLKRLSSRKGVKAVVILNNEGQAIRSTLDETLTKQYGQLISTLVQQARTTVNTLDDQVQNASLSFFHIALLTLSVSLLERCYFYARAYKETRNHDCTR